MAQTLLTVALLLLHGDMHRVLQKGSLAPTVFLPLPGNIDVKYANEFHQAALSVGEFWFALVAIGNEHSWTVAGSFELT